MRDMTHSHAWHDSFICVAWLIHMHHVTRNIATLSFTLFPCDMTHSYAWHDSFICVTWLIRMRDMTHSNVWHVFFICVTWLTHMCDITHSHAWHHSFISVKSLFHVCDMTHIFANCVGTSSFEKSTKNVGHDSHPKKWEDDILYYFFSKDDVLYVWCFMCDVHMCNIHMCDIHMCDMHHFRANCIGTPSFEKSSKNVWHDSYPKKNWRKIFHIIFFSKDDVSNLWRSYVWHSYMWRSYVWRSYVWHSCVWHPYVWHSYVWLSYVWHVSPSGQLHRNIILRKIKTVKSLLRDGGALLCICNIYV